MIAHNQLRVVRALWERLQPLDRATPERLRALLADRRFGSRDRRLYRELLFTAMRLARTLVGVDEATWAARVAAGCADRKETAAFRAAFAAAGVPCDELDLLPGWFAAGYEASEAGEVELRRAAAALLGRAPVWVRLREGAAGEAEAAWAGPGWAWTTDPEMPAARRLPPETPVTDLPAYQTGRYEVQDLGSQAVLAALDLPARSPGARWLDACAGAGGKTLQLAELLGPSARVLACDPRASALAELRLRAGRSGLASRIETRATPGNETDFDGVLVDAPCTGSGTWRRAPHLMACTSEAELAAAARVQLEILTASAHRVRPGGLLAYATCSIAKAENSDVARAFLASPAGAVFRAEPPPRALGFGPGAAGLGLFMAPGLRDNDGLYLALFRRASV